MFESKPLGGVDAEEIIARKREEKRVLEEIKKAQEEEDARSTFGIKPLGDRIVINRVEEEEERGGIFIPYSAREKTFEGRVVALGAGPAHNVKCGICGKLHKDGQGTCFKKGWRVIVSKFAGMSIAHREPGTRRQLEFEVIREEDIVVRIVEE